MVSANLSPGLLWSIGVTISPSTQGFTTVAKSL